jgi:mRNA-degrading endonuclease RelE of RelBE toxin-antitoxin system
VATVQLSSQAEKFLDKLSRSDRRLYDRIDQALDRLRDDPLLGKPLQGPLAGLRSLRVGNIRIIHRFEAERLLIFVLDIARRDKVYRDLE